MHRRDARHLGPHTRCVSAAATAGAYQHRHSTHRLRPPCPSRMQTGCTREPARRERRRGRADFAPCGSREDCVTTRRANHRDRAGPASPALGRRLLAACHTTSRQRVSAVTQACQRVPAGVGPFWRAGVGSFSRAPKGGWPRGRRRCRRSPPLDPGGHGRQVPERDRLRDPRGRRSRCREAALGEGGVGAGSPA